MNTTNVKEEIAEKLLKIAKDYKNDGNKLKVYRRYKAVRNFVSDRIRLYRYSRDKNIELLREIDRVLTQGYNLLLNGNKIKVLTKLAEEIRNIKGLNTRKLPLKIKDVNHVSWFNDTIKCTRKMFANSHTNMN